MKKTLFFLLLVPIFFFLMVHTSTSVPRKSSEPTFSDITVTSSSTHLLLFAMLENSFTDEMTQGLHSGLPIYFSFYVQLAPTEKGWNDEECITIESGHLLRYDTLKETYTVEIEESGKRFFTFQNLEKAQKTTSEINGLKVIELVNLQTDTSYTLRLRAELYKKTLPMGLHKIIPFISWWDVQTDWHSISFTL